MPTSGDIAKGNDDLAKIESQKKQNRVCNDKGSAPTVKAQTIDELHSLQKKKPQPTTPKGTQATFFTISEDERHKQQLQSIRYLSTYEYCYIGMC